jgi:predicted DNA-binding transcriptional regulator YafY
VLRFCYVDRHGDRTTREMEPLGYIGSPTHWYLLGWCRLRDAARAFRLDRIIEPVATDETVTPRPFSAADLDIPAVIRTPMLVG